MVKVSKSITDVAAKVTEMINGGLKFSAVMASEDLLAIGALKALQHLNLSMPVIGFNNSILSQCSSPALTTVDNMLDTLCPTAIKMLIDILDNKMAPQKIVISSKLIERDTFQKINTVK